MALNDLIVAKTADDMLAEELANAQAEGLPTTSWQSGSVVRTVLLVLARVFAMFSAVIIQPIRGGFGDLLASLAWTRLWAKQGYDLDAVEAQPATGHVDATNTSTTEYTLAIGDLILASRVSGKLYRNTAAAVIPASGSLADIPISSIEVGTANNAAPGDVADVVAPSLAGVTFTNPLPVLGADDETVPAIVARSRAKLGALSPEGPKDAYDYVVKTPELALTSTPITRSTTRADPLTGIVTVYVATADGGAVDADVAACQAAIDKWAEPWCVTATAATAVPATVDVAYAAYVRSALSEDAIKAAIALALSEYFSALPIGGDVIAPATLGYLYVDALVVAIAGATSNGAPIGAVRVSVSLPAADFPLYPNKVAVLGTVTGTVTFL